MSANTIINVTTEPIKREHVAWYTDEYYEGHRLVLTLKEVVLSYYDHPMAKGMALIPILETITVSTHNAEGLLHTLKHNQMMVSEFMERL